MSTNLDFPVPWLPVFAVTWIVSALLGVFLTVAAPDRSTRVENIVEGDSQLFLQIDAIFGGLDRSDSPGCPGP